MMNGTDRLETVLETYRGLISDDEMISARLSRLDRKREKLQRQQAGIYESMDAAERQIRKLLEESATGEPESPPRDKRRGRRKKVELTEEEVVSCEKLAEELMGGK